MRARRLWVAVLVAALLAGCVSRAPAAPATMRESPPPWPAPRDAISYLELTGLPHVRLDATDNQRILTLRVTIDGTAVEVPGLLGIDRVRAVQAPVHTHDASGHVWLEGQGADQVLLRHVFQLWGVRADARCLGSVCGTLTVTVDGHPVANWPDLRLVEVQREIDVEMRTG